LWLFHALKDLRTIYHWWGFSVIAILGIHSLLEYPLWYAYFIGIAAISLGLMESKTYRLELRLVGRLSVALMLVLGIVTVAQLRTGYKKLEASLAVRPLSNEDTTYMTRLRDSLVEVNNYALLRPYAELYMTSLIEVSADHLPYKLALNTQAMRFVPIGTVVYRQAWLLALDGHLPEAKVQLENSIWSYPADFAAAQAELKILALKDPIHFSTLLEFATQKNEEYQRAVSGK
jgi:hypothetical protein